MDKEKIIKQYQDFVMSTYARTDLVIAKGKGSKVWDITGDEYIDFFPGWAVSGIGHCHDRIVSALKKQLDYIIHVPNNYYNLYQAKLAQELVKLTFPGKAFFCNSGAESIEAAIKLSRLYGSLDKRYKIIVMENSFHGRSLGALSATAQKKYHKGFYPLLEGFITAKFNDIESVKKNLNEEIVAIMIEPIQGEGGINVAEQVYLQQLRNICDENNILLIFDEVQTGMGRTGNFFCFQNYGIKPDIIALAKSLASGFPMGAIVAGKKCKDIFNPGSHASTFGGSPLACIAALETIKIIQDENLLQNVNKMQCFFISRLEEIKNKVNYIKNIRGQGLMLGIELNKDGSHIVKNSKDRGLLINCTQGNIIRVLPAINIDEETAEKGLKILEEVFICS